MSKTIIRSTKNSLIQELHKNQLRDVPISKKLQYNDFKRIIKNIGTSIFNNDICCIWKGYITNINKPDKGIYVNFYFRDKKIALHRLLYANYIGNLNDDEYLKFSCHNHGKCCNINHLKKYKYNNDKADDNIIDVKKIITPDNELICDIEKPQKTKRQTKKKGAKISTREDIDNITIYFE